MDATTREELRMLRARAYGPAADIDEDPGAARRLRELEAGGAEAMVRPAVPSTVAGDPGAPAPADDPAGTAPSRSEPTPDPGRDAVAGPAEAAPPSPGRATRRPVSRLVRVWWAVSLVIAGTAAAAATYAVTSLAPVQASHGAPQIATLERSTTVEVPSGWFGAGPSSAAFEFYGLTIFETTGGYGYGVGGSECISAVPTEQLPAPDADPNSWSVQGNVYSGCRVGTFPATVQMVVDSGVPEPLRAQFPARSALQFVFDGERIGVFLDAPE